MDYLRIKTPQGTFDLVPFYVESYAQKKWKQLIKESFLVAALSCAVATIVLIAAHIIDRIGVVS
jgi:hypothetical protein